MPQLKSRKRQTRRRRNTRRRVARRGAGAAGNETIEETFKRVTGANTSKQIGDWFNANASRTPKDLAGTDLEYFKEGSRMIHFIVRRKGTNEDVSVGFESDY